MNIQSNSVNTLPNLGERTNKVTIAQNHQNVATLSRETQHDSPINPIERAEQLRQFQEQQSPIISENVYDSKPIQTYVETLLLQNNELKENLHETLGIDLLV